MDKNKQIDFLAIGDIVTEPFIKIDDAEVECAPDGDACKLSFRFGDKIPYKSAEEFRAFGNSPNAAVCASKLGLNTCLISYVGEDSVGKGNIEALVGNNVGIDYMETVPGMISNYHYVLWHKTERTILVKHNEYPYSFPADLPEPKWIYLSSLASNSLEYHNQIVKYLKKHPDVNLAFQPGTFQIKLGVPNLKEIYNRTQVLLCNRSEAQRILKNTDENEPVKLIKKLYNLGPEMVVMTDGSKGAYVYEGKNIWFLPAYPARAVERTGAGDAFSSTFLSALILDKNIEEALLWAGINAMSVIQEVGTQKGLLKREQIEEILTKAPEDYKPIKLK